MFRLSNYWALCLLILIPYAFYMSKKSLADLSSWRRWSAFGLRAAVIILLVLALAGFKLIWKVDILCVLFALDASNSIPDVEHQRASDFIRNAMENIKDDDQAGLIVFGKEAYVEMLPTVKPEAKAGMPSIPSADYTNIGAAVITAMDLFPESVQKRIVLITDGNENVGNVMDDAIIAKSSGIRIFTVPLSAIGEGAAEVLVDALIAPGSVALGRVFELKAIVRSTVEGSARLKLFRDKVYLDEKDIQLSAVKRQVFTFSQVLNSEGTYIYEVLIEPAVDTMRENNLAKALVIATGRPRILYMSQDNLYTDYLYQILTQKGMEVVPMTDPSRMPTSLSEMQNYSAVVFNNIPADSLSAAQMKMIQNYVHDLGGGFVMIGGENSFGNGGYYKTPIEEVLPVNMIPERKKRSISMVLAIDKSGSMAIPTGGYLKLDLAKEAAISVVEFLTDKDQVGVIAFDVETQDIVELEKVISKGKIEDKISSISPGGGTNIYPAIETAYRWLKDADTQLKHLILVSDGRSQQPDKSYPLVREMSQNKITVSTIAIGDDADRETMRRIAGLGMGRYYETKDAGNLPRIFVKEAFVASKLIMEGDFRLVVSGDIEILKGIDTSHLPPLRGYVGTSAKEGASVIILSGVEDPADPILSVWQYGLGRTLAFTSDARPKWAVEWLKWMDFSKFWSQAIGWSLALPSGEFDVYTDISGSICQITVNAVDSRGRFRNFLDFQARLIKPDLGSEILPLNQSGPGRYEAEFNAEQMGTYLLRVSEMREGKVLNSQNSGAVVSYSPEYRSLESNHALLADLASATDGKFNPEIEAITAHEKTKIWRLQDIWRWLVIVSIPLFFLDVALRRVAISKEQISELRDRFRLRKTEKAPGTTAGTLINLRQRKQAISYTHKAEYAETITKAAIDRAQTAAETEGTYTSRLLEVKKRTQY